MSTDELTRDELAARYLEQLPYEPYPVQEEALLTWFTAEQGVLVCAPTGTGKTLIAEAALFEALHTGQVAYYTTPLIALTEQKFREMQDAAESWGFSADDVGLVTGNRRVNPDAPILVVVAEILFNRLLHPEAFDFSGVASVVMDEFHSFNDRERGIVWELSLGLLPAHVRTLLLSATVGNALEFVQWLNRSHERRIELVQGDERKVPLTFQWIGDELLNEHLAKMADGDDEGRKVPALVFCFNRDECWNVAEQMKGKRLISDAQQKELAQRLGEFDWSQGAGPKLRQLLLRGVGVHHAGVMPKYRRIVEDMFQLKLLAIVVCTETLSAGINLPARSVVIPQLLKGPSGDKKLLDPSTAHQIFGRAGRPQYDDQGYVFSLAHPDDVKIQRWRVKYDSIPEDTKDPGLRKAKKALKKKMPKRRSTEQYWTESQFDQLRAAPPRKLASRGGLPWRLLSYMLDASPEVERVRTLVGKRLATPKQLEAGQRALTGMLLTLWTAGYVELEPRPPLDSGGKDGEGAKGEGGDTSDGGKDTTKTGEEESTSAKPKGKLLTADDLFFANVQRSDKLPGPKPAPAKPTEPKPADSYQPEFAYPTESLDRLLGFRSVNPLYGVFAVNQMGIADRNERLQIMESMLEMPGTVARHVRVPKHDQLPPGPLATTRLDVKLLQLGLVTPEQLGIVERDDEEDDRRGGMFEEERVWVLNLADKLRLLFDNDFPGVHDLRIVPVWVVGELFEFGGDFNKLVTSKRLQKQEGMLFRHLLRLVLLIAELRMITPPDTTEEEWREDLDDITDRIVASCHGVDPTSTDKAVEQAASANC